MKVLKTKEWVDLQEVCSNCESHLEIELGDVNYEYDQESCQPTFNVECIVCGARLYLSSEKVPHSAREAIKNNNLHERIGLPDRIELPKPSFVPNQLPERD
jgi:hypothetical protein